MPRAYRKKPTKAAYQKAEKAAKVTPKKMSMKRLCSDNYGKQYAKEQYELYSDASLFLEYDWKAHTQRMRSMCGIAYWLDTSDEDDDNREAAMAQAESTWVWSWTNKGKEND